jgi:hypothetical protein
MYLHKTNNPASEMAFMKKPSFFALHHQRAVFRLVFEPKLKKKSRLASGIGISDSKFLPSPSYKSFPRKFVISSLFQQGPSFS